jgi:hypothetical protein
VRRKRRANLIKTKRRVPKSKMISSLKRRRKYMRKEPQQQKLKKQRLLLLNLLFLPPHPQFRLGRVARQLQ